MSNESHTLRGIPLVFGDVETIRYPDGEEIIDGQAFGIAWHLQGFARPPLLISRIGDDTAGNNAVRAMEKWELRTDGIQRGVDQPTDYAKIHRGHDSPTYSAPSEQSWGRISAREASRKASTIDCALIAHGARCLRSASNRRALDRLIEDTEAPIYFDATNDIFLLDKYEFERCLDRSRWITVRQRDLPAIGAMLSIAPGEPEEIAMRLSETYDITAIFAVSDSGGAFTVNESKKCHWVEPTRELHVVDRTGVEEAVTAVAIYGLLAGWHVSTILRRAQGFSELIAALPVPEIPVLGLYDDARNQWAEEIDDSENRNLDDSSVHATLPISKEARLPAELKEAVDTLDNLRQREEMAQMRANVAFEIAADGDKELGEYLERAERSLTRIRERIDETEDQLQSLKRIARESRVEQDAEENDVESC